MFAKSWHGFMKIFIIYKIFEQKKSWFIPHNEWCIKVVINWQSWKSYLGLINNIKILKNFSQTNLWHLKDIIKE